MVELGGLLGKVAGGPGVGMRECDFDCDLIRFNKIQTTISQSIPREKIELMS